MSLGRIEVDANGQTYVDEASYASGTPRPGFEIEDSALVDKFRHNAERVLSREQIDKAIAALMQLDTIPNVSHLVDLITP